MDKEQRKRKRAEEKSTQGASSSSSISPEATGLRSGQYDVFLNFRGLDTRKTFTDHLYHNLVKAGTVPFCVFRDENNIPIGEEFGSEILDAIIRSKISIPVISENYALSKWCLRELVHIMECKKRTSHMVLPIFYKVAPSDVRHLKGNFGNAFRLSWDHFDEKDIQEWQRALNEVSYLHGWESDKLEDGHEGKLIEHVVETVRSILREDFLLDVPKQLVGLDGHMKEIMTWIDNPSSSARMIGIYGMGGIGKTTLAKCIYNSLLNKFGHASFLPDVRETARRHNITYLQHQLILDILKDTNEVSRIDDGINIIKSGFRGKNVLILLDDIDEKNQLDALARERDWFMAGSLIIVTTRNKAILDQSEFDVDIKYELNELDMVQAMLLFNRHAFRTNYSLRDFEGISSDIVATMGGLPLAVKVVGSYLYKKMNRGVWEDVRKKLKNQPYRDVQEILQISYDALEDGHKQIFLDIVCFFIGEMHQYAMYMWEDCGFYPSQGIEELKLRCLIKIGDHGEFLVHDQLRDLGRSIFCQGQSLELEKRTGPWDNDYKGVPRVIRQTERPIHNLLTAPASGTSCFYDILRAAASGTSNDKLLYEVRWLEWEVFGSNSWEVFGSNSYLPPFNLHLPKLSVLMIGGIGFTQDWKEWSSFMASKGLKILLFKYFPYLRSTPDLSAFTQLKILKLSECWALEHLHPSIGKLTSLLSLDLSHCWRLKELPQEVGELEDLEELSLNDSAITEIPTSIDSLRKLKILSVWDCKSLREIPSSIGDLQNLQHLNLSYSAIKKLPSAIGDLQNLQHLDLSHSAIEKLPSAIGSLRKLEKLRARSCRSLREIPNSIGDLQNLQHLDLNWSAIEKLPSEIGDLPSLQILDMGDMLISDLLESIRNLSSLQSLQLNYCNKLCWLPELPSGLTSLSICCQSPMLPQVSSLIHLKELYLDHCHLLEDILELSSRLLKLTIKECDKLILLKLNQVEYLEDLYIRGCSFIERLDLSCLNHLKKLKVEDCNNLVEIQGPDGAKFLEPLNFMGCKSMETLKDLNGCQRLEYVVVRNCKKLTQLRGFEKLDIFKLNTSGCDSLERTGLFDNYKQ